MKATLNLDELDARSYVAPNYHPLPVSIVSGTGAWVTDAQGRRYLDLLSAYSALNFGHCHPRLVAAAQAQLQRLTLTSRAFSNDLLEVFCQRLATLTGLDMVLPMNTGAEAVETAIKAARLWGHLTKGIPDGGAEIIVCDRNFHGRTTTLVSLSGDPNARDGFGPFTPGFVSVPHGDDDALEAAIGDRTVAVLLEPIQGEAGVLVPPPGYLRRVREICDQTSVLFIADEIQSGLGRTGATFACDHESVRPDVLILGKALGGGILPISAVVARADVLKVMTAGRHGSTFGGNPLACAVALEVLDMLATGEPQAAAADLGIRLRERLLELPSDVITEVRTHGLWAGIDLAPTAPSARVLAEAMLERQVLVKDTHGSTLRIAPPLIIEAADLEWACNQLADAVGALR